MAEIFQIGTQLLTGKKPATTPMLSFSPALSIGDLGGADAPDGTLLKNLTDHATQLFVTSSPHLNYGFIS